MQADGKVNLAWALMATAILDVNDPLKLDMGFCYINLGKVTTTSVLNCTCGEIG